MGENERGSRQMKSLEEYSWNKVLCDVYELVRKVKDSNYMPDYIITFYRNGMLPALIFAYQFKIKDFLLLKRHRDSSSFLEEAYWEDLTHFVKMPFGSKNILILDDIYDTGKTIEEVRKRIEIFHPKIAVIDCKEDKLNKVDYYINIVRKDVWIHYPWEIKNVCK